MNNECPTPPEPLPGPTVLLRRWETEDAGWYVAARDDEVFRWTSEPRDLSVHAVREAIQGNRQHPRWVGLAIADAASGVLLGNIALRPARERPHEGEISYWLAPQGRGRGAATEAVRLLVEWALHSGAFRRVTLHTKPANSRSQAVALRAGFRLEHADESGAWFALEDSPARP